MGRPANITIIEVGPRDGLQNESQVISAADKIRFIEMLVNAGLVEIEVGSFVSPKWVPQMADTDAVVQGLSPLLSRFVPWVLVPNEKGMEAALASGLKHIAIFTAASDTFNQKNIHCTIDESFARFAPVLALARAQSVRVRGYVSTAFFCPYEGKISANKAVEVILRLNDLGVDDISIGDTIGKATPHVVRELLEILLGKIHPKKISLHFHDTYGSALANVSAALEYGISRYDASTAGLGGCPYAPGASGNVATNDLVWFLHEEGMTTGIDLGKLNQAGRFIQSVLQKPLPSRILAAQKS